MRGSEAAQRENRHDSLVVWSDAAVLLKREWRERRREGEALHRDHPPRLPSSDEGVREEPRHSVGCVAS